MKRVRCWLLFAMIILLGACISPVTAPVGDHSKTPVQNPGYHTVQVGDTLYSVAFQYGYAVDQLARWNRLQPPYTIYKKQRLRVKPPPVSKQTKVSASLPKPRQTTTIPRQTRAAKPVAASVPKTKKAPARSSVRSSTKISKKSNDKKNKKLLWSWPANGKVIQGYNPRRAGKKGISIAGRSGDPIRAAAAGKVVYAGSGLSGYGRLIIVKHSKEFLSAYAHNRKLIARDGQWVGKGEIIARMGNSGTDRTRLHFEIRKQGRPVNPLNYLPRR